MGRKKDEFYLGKYLIALYNDYNDDELVALLDNIHDYADFLEISVGTASTNLHDYFYGHIKHVLYHGKILTVYFIRIDED